MVVRDLRLQPGELPPARLECHNAAGGADTPGGEQGEHAAMGTDIDEHAPAALAGRG